MEGEPSEEERSFTFESAHNSLSMEAVPETAPMNVPFASSLGNLTHAIGFDAKAVARRNLLRKTVDYSATIVRHLEVLRVKL